RRAKPVQNLLPRPSMAAAERVDQRRCFVPALVAGEPQERQGYLRFDARAAGLREAFFDALDLDFGFFGRAGAFAAAFFTVTAARAFPSLGARYTGTNRNSSPTAWYV